MTKERKTDKKLQDNAVYKIEVTGGKNPHSTYIEGMGELRSKRLPGGEIETTHHSFVSCFLEALPDECVRLNIYDCHTNSAGGSMILIAAASYESPVSFDDRCPEIIRELCSKKKIHFIRPEKKKRKDLSEWPYLSNESSPLR